MSIEQQHAAKQRQTALMNYYAAERRAGVDSLTAHERMAEFAKRLDNLDSDYLRELAIIKACMERNS